MMLPYARNVRGKLLALRLLFFLLFPLCIFLFYQSVSNGGYLLAAVLPSISFFDVTGLLINDNSIRVIKYFFFGLLPITWGFEKDQLTNARFYKEHEAEYLIVPETLLGCIGIFFPVRVQLNYKASGSPLKIKEEREERWM